MRKKQGIVMSWNMWCPRHLEPLRENWPAGLIRDRLGAPLLWRKPRRVFVNSMSDLFHEDVADEFIDRVFAIMALTPQHAYQVLTKRPDRMRAYVSAEWRAKSVYLASLPVRMTGEHYAEARMNWPLPNVWLGTSVENQAAADERILTLGHEVYSHYDRPSLLDATEDWCALDRPGGIDWVIVGGESGPHARPCDVEWIRSIVAQCTASEVPVFVKQLGNKPITGEMEPTGRFRTDPATGRRQFEMKAAFLKLRSRHGSDPDEWPEDLRVREFPEVHHCDD